MRAISIARHFVLASAAARLRRRTRVTSVNGVAVAAHDAGLRRNVVGENPVAAFAGELGLGIGGDILGFGGKADHQFWPLRLAVGDGREDVGIFRRATAPASPCRPAS